jgi:hypothetical protein
MPMPYVQEWNLEVQRSIGSQWMASLTELGNKLTHEQLRINPNQATPPTGPNDKSTIQSRRPYPWVGDIYEAADVGDASYNGMQAVLQRRMANGYSFQVNYVWSKAMDFESSGINPVEYGRDVQLDHGASDFNPAQTFKLSGVYELPVGPGHVLARSNNWLNRDVIGGWQASGILTVFSGLPFNVTAIDLSDTGIYHSQRANQTCSGNNGAPHTIAKWFNTTCFVQPGYGELGDEQRNNLIGPRDTNLDLSLFKEFPLVGERTLQFRSDFFSALNHPLLDAGTPSNSISSPTFGQIVSIGGARAIQMSLKFLF